MSASKRTVFESIERGVIAIGSAIEALGHTAVWMYRHPRISFIGAMLLSGVVSYSAFHTAGHDSSVNDQLLNDGNRAVEIGQQHKLSEQALEWQAHLAQIHHNPTKYFGDTGLALTESNSAFEQTSIAAADFVSANQVLGDKETAVFIGLGFAIGGVVSTFGEGFAMIDHYNKNQSPYR